MIKYRYTIDNSTIEVLSIAEIPNGIQYETIEEHLSTYLDYEAAKEIDLFYTKKISDLLRKHIEKNIIDGTPIPSIVLSERDRLKTECNNKITNELGITDFSYRMQIFL